MDQTFAQLSNQHRRRLLVALLDQEPHSEDPIRVPDDIRTGDEDIRRLGVEMIHNHLPRLEEAGLIRWNRETNDVHRGSRFEEIRPFLELLSANADGLPGEWVGRPCVPTI